MLEFIDATRLLTRNCDEKIGLVVPPQEVGVMVSHRQAGIDLQVADDEPGREVEVLDVFALLRPLALLLVLALDAFPDWCHINK